MWVSMGKFNVCVLVLFIIIIVVALLFMDDVLFVVIELRLLNEGFKWVKFFVLVLVCGCLLVLIINVCLLFWVIIGMILFLNCLVLIVVCVFCCELSV